MSRTGHFDKSCLFSTVRNTSGRTMTFSFLPPHGTKLEADEEYSVFGNILEAVNRGARSNSRRQHQALADALDRGDLEILSTPAPILVDQTTDDVKILRLNSGTLSVADPCWRDSDSLEVDVAP